LSKDSNITKQEWLGFALNKSILIQSNIKDCVIGGYINDFDYDDVDIYDAKFSGIDDVNYWFAMGYTHGWLTETGCVKHELNRHNFVFTLQDIKILYPDKLPEIRKRTHIPENKDWFAYQASEPEMTKELLNKALEFSSCDTLIDIGCGLGEVLKIGSDVGYENVVGLEIQEELVELARKDARLEIIHGSGSDYHLPDKKLHVFMFNPFSNNVMIDFLNNNIENIKRNNSLVIYNYAFSGHHLMVMYGLKMVYTNNFATIYAAEQI
jgi:hypothetical protein